MRIRKIFLALLVLVLVLSGCAPAAGLWGNSQEATLIPPGSLFPSPAATSTETALPTLPPTATVISSPTGLSTPTAILTSTPAANAIQRVLIISFDGLRPDAIERAHMKNLIAFMNSGAYTLNAQTVYPSTTLPAHSSMLVGTCVSRHHVIWDDYIPENGYARGVDLFDIAHAAGLRTVMIVGKEKLRQITEPGSTDVFEAYDFSKFQTAEYSIVPRAVEEIKNGFGLMFVHFPTGDVIGHKEGWMSYDQRAEFRTLDGLFGKLIAALDDNGMSDSTLIIVTADHGGHDTTHGSQMPEDMTIPWIIAGPGIQPMQLTTDVQIMDTAATAAYALHLQIPVDWQGVPVTEAFGLPVSGGDAVVCQ